MKVPSEELLSALRELNPWWSGRRVAGLPVWRRAAFAEIAKWMQAPYMPRALLLSGARQIGKTTLVWQCIENLVEAGVPPQNILYATLDGALLKLAGLEAIIATWRDFEPPREGVQYLFVDEIQHSRGWQTWLKHQVDFHKERRILVTGSAAPLETDSPESGVGRWHTIRLATLSFYEYLRIRSVEEPPIAPIDSLRSLAEWTPASCSRAGAASADLVPHFHEYLLRGGFPQLARLDNIDIVQRLLQEDIVDRVLKRDLTAQFGVRNVLELERVFLYLCMHDGGLLDMQALCSALEINRQTVSGFLQFLEAAHLIHRIRPHGYGKAVLRAQQKVYLADPAIAPSVMSSGKQILSDPARLGHVVETAVFKHLVARYYPQRPTFSYWRGKKGIEVDIIAEAGARTVPFEVKYRTSDTGLRNLAGIVQFCRERSLPLGYVITRAIDDFRVLEPDDPAGLRLVKIPAPLFCYWLGKLELDL